MRKLSFLGFLFLALSLTAQETANRFFYELTFKPKKDSARLEKVLTILDITPKKSVYQDYTVIAQDSIIKVEVEKMQKSGTMNSDFSKSIKKAKFSEKIYKFYPEMKIEFVEQILSGFQPSKIGYNETLNLDWKLSQEQQKIGEYNTQKATTNFGGRNWIAWFATDLPFVDGPYKFSGLPGLIVKIEDDRGNYSWTLVGNKKIENYSEFSYVETMMGANANKPNITSKEKFEKIFDAYKKDPFASMRPMLTQEMLSTKLPNSDKTLGEILKDGEKEVKELYGANNNPIELPQKK